MDIESLDITLKDIADEVGISISTVSRALSPEHTEKVKPTTIKKINQAIEKLSLENNTTLNLGPPQVKSIGIVISITGKSLSHLLFSQMIDYLETHIRNAGYTVRYTLSQSSLSTEKLYDEIANNKTDGIIVLGPLGAELLAFLKKHNKNLLYIGVNPQVQDIDSVTTDGHAAITTIFDHFYSLGRRNIGYIGTTVNQADGISEHTRFTSYKESLDMKQMPLEYMQSATDSIEDGYSAMYKMLSQPNRPDAIICSGDSIAIGVIRAASENGVRIPEDIAIAGMDNVKLSKYLVPSLTTINMRIDDMTRLAVEVLSDKITGNYKQPVNLHIPYNLVIRESCGYNRREID